MRFRFNIYIWKWTWLNWEWIFKHKYCLGNVHMIHIAWALWEITVKRIKRLNYESRAWFPSLCNRFAANDTAYSSSCWSGKEIGVFWREESRKHRSWRTQNSQHWPCSLFSRYPNCQWQDDEGQDDCQGIIRYNGWTEFVLPVSCHTLTIKRWSVTFLAVWFRKTFVIQKAKTINRFGQQYSEAPNMTSSWVNFIKLSLFY